MTGLPEERRRRPAARDAARSKKMLTTQGRTRRQYAPSMCGLTDAELGREAARLFRSGWSVWEIRAVLDLPLVIP